MTNRNTRQARQRTSRERILLFGKEGTGKSFAHLTIAEALPNVKFYVIDTDDTTERLLEDQFQQVGNVEAIVVQNWDEFETETKDVLAEIERTVKANTPRQELPWLVIDMSDITWDWAQESFTERVWDEGIEDYFIEARKSLGRKGAKKIQAFEGWTDWLVIKKIYWAAWTPLTRGRKYHLFLTAKSGEVKEERDIKDLYSELKAMPTGEKTMGHKVHTVLYLKTSREHGWVMSSAKDRGRDLVMNEPLGDFVEDYLRDIAGWSIDVD